MKVRTGYLIKRGKKFYACWTISGRKFMKTTGKTDRREAQSELARIMEPYLVQNDLRTLQSVKARIEGTKAELVALDERENPPVAVSKAWLAYIEAPERPDSGEGTLRQYEAECRRFTKWLQKNHAAVQFMREVTPAHATAYAQDLNHAAVSPSTYNQHIGFLRLLWKVLRSRIRGEGNPWESIRRRNLVMQSRRELTVEELRAVCKAAKGERRLLFAMGIYTGMRLGDCATLRWGEVDLHRGIIRRVPTKVARRKPAPITIPIHAVLSAMLKEAKLRGGAQWVLPETAALYQEDSSTLAKRIQEHFEACDVRTHRPGTGFETVKDEDGKDKAKHTGKRAVVEVGFHSLRHTFVSLCREANAPLSVVEAIVGHSNPAMTRHYTHTSEAAAGAAVAALPDITGQTKPALPAPDAGGTVPKAKVRALAEQLTPRTAKAIREQLFELAAAI